MSDLRPGWLVPDYTHVADVVAVAAEGFDVAPEVLTGHDRHMPLMVWRHAAMAAAREFGHSYPAIGRAFGNRNSATVMNACHRVAGDENLALLAKRIVEAARNRPGSLF